jgi:hypothetical protein
MERLTDKQLDDLDALAERTFEIRLCPRNYAMPSTRLHEGVIPALVAEVREHRALIKELGPHPGEDCTTCSLEEMGKLREPCNSCVTEMGKYLHWRYRGIDP